MEPPARHAIVDAFGARWHLDVQGLGDPLAGRMAELWDRATVDTSGPDPTGPDDDVPAFTVRRDGERLLVQDAVYAGSGDDSVPYTVSRALTVASIGRRAGSCLLLHAAGVAAPDGATLALVAPSGTGKTTAARTLGRSLGYVSDETVAVEGDLTVRGYPKPLSVVVDPESPHDKRESSPDELGLVRAPGRLHLAGVVLLERDPAIAQPSLEPLGLVEAMVGVVPQTSALLRMADPLESLATALSQGSGPWLLRYAEIADCEHLLTGLLTASPAPPRGTWSSEVGPVVGASLEELAGGPRGVVVPVPSATTVVRRAPWRRALHTDGDSLVVVGAVPFGLPGMASTLWRSAAEPVTVGALVEAAVRVHGEHPEAADVVTATVRALIGTGAFEPVGD